MTMPLEVVLIDGKGGSVSGPFQSPTFPPGTIFEITGASLMEVRLVVGAPDAPISSVKLTVLDTNDTALIWNPGSTQGGSIDFPPPPPGGSRVVVG